MSNTITVWSGGHLMWAARAAKAGDTILLAPGNYGDVTLSHINAKGTITIRSANLDNEAVFRTLAFTNAHGIVIENIDVVRPLNPGERHNSTAMQVNRSSNITFSGLELHGSLDGNAIGDGHGMSVSGSNRISILNSTFQQLNATVIVANSNDFLFAGNTVKNVQEGISISSVNRGVFEQNYMADWQANHAAGAHPDMFQVHSGGKAVASTNLIFRDNVMLPGDKPVGGIFIRSEGVGRGIRHDNILIENNFYEGAYRHAIGVGNSDDVIVRNNTVLMGNHQGLVPAINLTDIRSGLIENNLSTMILEHRIAKNSDMTFSGNVDVWDWKQRRGVAVNDLFDARESGAIDFGSLTSNESANPSRAGFVAVANIGSLSGNVAAQIAAWLPSYDQQFAVFG